MATSQNHKGWKYDADNDRLQALFDGTEVFDFDANDMVITPATTVTGALTASSTLAVTGAITASAGLTSTSATAPIGYATGAGGAVTQITTASTGVTLSKPTGQITTVALTTAAAAEEAFEVTNTLVDANDVIVVNTTYAGGGKPIVFVTNVGAGVFTINISNVHASAALDAALVVNFAVIKGVAA